MTTTAVQVFREVALTHPRMFWLDGGGSREWSGRCSIVGWLEPDDVSLTYDAARRKVSRHTGTSTEVVGDDVFTVLRDELARDGSEPSVSWVGYFGYASRADLPAQLDDAGRVPDAVWMRTRNLRVFDDEVGVSGFRDTLASPGPLETGSSLALLRTSPQPPDRAAYDLGFERVQEQLHLGNSYEVNLTYRRQVVSQRDPVEAYLRLRRVNPAPYSGYLQHHGTHLLSSSPERFATIDRNRWVEARPIKGTTPRGITPEADAELAESLSSDPRFSAENLMIVDLMRNDLSMVCEPGTVTVPGLMQVESYASVHQLVSTIRGRLRDGVETVQALRALFPAGSMTGAPKLRTMEIIADVETGPRGVYAGAFGWISGDGRADLGVVIRSLVATADSAGGAAYRYELGTGGGITVRSAAESEYAETLWKAERVLAALG
jgi:para-aminobenzoate synthetase